MIEPREKAIIRDECNLTQRDVFTTTKKCTSVLTVYDTKEQVRQTINRDIETREVKNFVLIFSVVSAVFMSIAFLLGTYGLSMKSENLGTFFSWLSLLSILPIGISAWLLDPAVHLLSLVFVSILVGLATIVFSSSFALIQIVLLMVIFYWDYNVLG